MCHTSGQPANAPKVYNDWAGTKHAIDSEGPSAALSLPYGSVCAGCHTANYDPSKVVPTPTATTTSTTSPYPTSVAWAASLPMVGSTPVLVLPQSQGNYPMSEFDIGCSSCHYGADVNGTIANQGNDPADTAHTAPVPAAGQRRHLRRLSLALLLHGRHVHRLSGPVRQAGRLRLADPEPVAHFVDPAADGARVSR